jgi:hypothetical protein
VTERLVGADVPQRESRKLKAFCDDYSQYSLTVHPVSAFWLMRLVASKKLTPLVLLNEKNKNVYEKNGLRQCS